MTFFESAATVMIAAGLLLIGFQFFVAAPENVQDKITSAFNVLDMNDAWDIQMEVSKTVFGGVEEFYEQFYIAYTELIIIPQLTVPTYITDAFQNASEWLALVSDNIASSHNSKFASAGVEASNGGRVLGEYYEKLGE